MNQGSHTDTKFEPDAGLRIDEVVVLWVDDPSSGAEEDRLGCYSNQPKPGCIDRSNRPEFARSEFRYWIPANAGPPEDVEQDYLRHEAYCAGRWHYEGCVARAVVSYPIGNGSRRLEYLSSGGLYGIESDSSPLYVSEVELEQLADLREHLKHFGIDWNNVAQKVEDEKRLRLKALQAEVV